MSIRVAVVDDQALVRSGFATMLGLQDDIEVVAEAGDGAAAVEIALAHRPDVILMDIRMPRMDGLTATKAIIEAADWHVDDVLPEVVDVALELDPDPLAVLAPLDGIRERPVELLRVEHLARDRLIQQVHELALRPVHGVDGARRVLGRRRLGLQPTASSGSR